MLKLAISRVQTVKMQRAKRSSGFPLIFSTSLQYLFAALNPINLPSGRPCLVFSSPRLSCIYLGLCKLQSIFSVQAVNPSDICKKSVKWSENPA